MNFKPDLVYGKGFPWFSIWHTHHPLRYVKPWHNRICDTRKLNNLYNRYAKIRQKIVFVLLSKWNKKLVIFQKSILYSGDEIGKCRGNNKDTPHWMTSDVWQEKVACTFGLFVGGVVCIFFSCTCKHNHSFQLLYNTINQSISKYSIVEEPICS